MYRSWSVGVRSVFRGAECQLRQGLTGALRSVGFAAVATIPQRIADSLGGAATSSAHGFIADLPSFCVVERFVYQNTRTDASGGYGGQLVGMKSGSASQRGCRGTGGRCCCTRCVPQNMAVWAGLQLGTGYADGNGGHVPLLRGSQARESAIPCPDYAGHGPGRSGDAAAANAGTGPILSPWDGTPTAAVPGADHRGRFPATQPAACARQSARG